MSIATITSNALSGLQASQAALTATSNNIANVNTPGYARQEVELAARVVAGAGAGVEVAEINRVTDTYLTNAAREASARAAGSEVTTQYIDRAQRAAGDPSSGVSIFDDVGAVFASFSELSADPSSVVRRENALQSTQATLGELDRLGGEIQTLRTEADSQIADGVARANELLEEVARLNGEIQRGNVTGDATGAENTRAQVLDELSQLIDIRIVEREGGVVDVRTSSGMLLAGSTAATLDYAAGGVAAPGRSYPPITVNPPAGDPQPLSAHISAGELHSLLQLRDQELPDIATDVSEYAAQTVDALNKAHNESAAFPAPNVLSGRNTGLVAGDALNFTGSTDLISLDAAGTLTGRISIDFDAGTASVDGGGTYGFAGGTIADLEAALQGALGELGGTATFANGALTLTGPTGEGLAAVQPETGASDRAGRGFSHFFGLNDLVSSTGPAFFETGLTDADTHQYAAGQTLTVQVYDENGTLAGEATIEPAAIGPTFGDVRTALNAAGTGLGDFGSFAPLDASNGGRFTFSPNDPNADLRIAVVDDNTARTDSGVAFSTLFGMGDAAPASRPGGFSVRADILADPNLLAAGRPQHDGAVIGEVIAGAGDGDGARLLAESGTQPRTGGPAGSSTVSVIDFGARFGAELGRLASAAEREQDSARAAFDEANARRASVEGVNMDEELVKLTVYQEAFSASSRLIQAAQEMSDTLLAMV